MRLLNAELLMLFHSKKQSRMKRLLSRWPIMALIAIAGSQPFTTAQVRITPYDMAQARLALTAAEKTV